MTHEFKKIVNAYQEASNKGLKAVLATVVHLEGSSYRRPGVRMLILNNDKMIGAVSGGCVEKEVLRQSQTVFNTGKAKMMTYDGRYRLGCEGTLYILLEVFDPASDFFKVFDSFLSQRKLFEIKSFFTIDGSHEDLYGSVVGFGKGHSFNLSDSEMDRTKVSVDGLRVFKQQMRPCFKLLIIGGEHDAVQLCLLASTTGWEVSVVTTIKDSKGKADFPGADNVFSLAMGELDTTLIDNETAVVLMTHNFANDLSYLLGLKESLPAYIGLLGPAHRREKLLDAFIDRFPEVNEDFLETVHGPAGLNIGAETPQEIAISIIAEILSIVRQQIPMPLQDKKGGIHDATNLTELEPITKKP